MKPDAYLKLYPGDWLRDTMHLDATCTGAYFLLILFHRGKPGIPSDDVTLRTVSRVRESDWARVKGIIGLYFTEKDGLWVNNRCVEDWERDCREYGDQVDRNKRAAHARWNAPRMHDAMHDACMTRCTMHANQNHNHNHSTKDIGQHRNESFALKPDEPKGAKESRPTLANDEDFIASLEKNPTYQGVDVRRELGKMTAWCSANNKQATRRRFVNWLNRCDKPMRTAPGQSTPVSNGAERISLERELDRIGARLKEIRGQAAEDAFGPHYDEKERDEMKRLKLRKSEITKKLGAIV